MSVKEIFTAFNSTWVVHVHACVYVQYNVYNNVNVRDISYQSLWSHFFALVEYEPHGIVNNPFDIVSKQTVIPAIETYFIKDKQSNIQAEKQVPDGER